MARSIAPEARNLPADAQPTERARLTRRRVLEAGLAYVDEHGLDALTMRKLGAALGVEGTALYNHVHGKDGLLDGLVELLWSETRELTDTDQAWPDVVRSVATAVREVTRRHPKAASLICSRSVMPLEALRLYGDCLTPMEQAGFDRAAAARILCVVSGYAYGYAVMELSALGCGGTIEPPETESQRIRRVAQMLPADVPDDLFEIGLAMCGCNAQSQFETGVDLIIAGLKPAKGRQPDDE